MQLKQLSVALFMSAAFAQNASLPSLADTLIEQEELSSLNDLLGSIPEIRNELEGMTNITVLAPSNDAIFSTMQTPMGWTLKKDADLLRAVMSYHVLNGSVASTDLSAGVGYFLPSLLTNTSFTNVTGGQVVEATKSPEGDVSIASGFTFKSNVVKADLEFNGGVIHIIDRILTIPQDLTITSQPLNLSTAENAFSLTGMIDGVNDATDLTVFAPSNAAFDALPTNISSGLNSTEMAQLLQYYIVNGTVDYLSANDTIVIASPSISTAAEAPVPAVNSTLPAPPDSAKIETPNVLLSNGVLHIIDRVILPPVNETAPVEARDTTAREPRHPHARPMNMPM